MFIAKGDRVIFDDILTIDSVTGVLISEWMIDNNNFEFLLLLCWVFLLAVNKVVTTTFNIATTESVVS